MKETRIGKVILRLCTELCGVVIIMGRDGIKWMN